MAAKVLRRLGPKEWPQRERRRLLWKDEVKVAPSRLRPQGPQVRRNPVLRRRSHRNKPERMPPLRRFLDNPFHGVECLSGAAASVEVVEARASPTTPLAWQEEDTLLEEKSLSPIGATSSPKAFQSPVSPPTLACSHIYRQSPLTEPREGSAVKQIADIVADAEAQILRRMEGWTSDGMVNQLATGTVSDLRLSSAIAGDCMKLKGTVEELKTKMAHLAEENLRLRNELFKRDDGNRTPRTPDTQTAMLQMMQQQLQQQQQLIQLLGSSQASLAAVAGVVTTPRGTQAAPAMLPAMAATPAAPAVVVRPPETVQVRPVVVSRSFGTWGWASPSQFAPGELCPRSPTRSSGWTGGSLHDTGASSSTAGWISDSATASAAGCAKVIERLGQRNAGERLVQASPMDLQTVCPSHPKPRPRLGEAILAVQKL